MEVIELRISRPKAFPEQSRTGTAWTWHRHPLQ